VTSGKIDRVVFAAAALVMFSAFGAGAATADPRKIESAAVAPETAGPSRDSSAAPADATPSAQSEAPSDTGSVAPPPDAAPTDTGSVTPFPDVAPADTGSAAPAPNPAPAATVPETAPAAASPQAAPGPDAAIAAQLRGLNGGKFDAILASAQDRAMIDAFYAGRDYAPLWLTDGEPNARAQAAMSYLAHVDADGLFPADYPVPDFAAAGGPEALAQAEIRLTASVIAYAHHAGIGRVHFSRVSGDIFYERKAPEPADVLSAMAAASDVAQALDAYEPHDPAYLALKAKLAALRAGKDGTIKIPDGPAPKIGAKDDRVPALRERLGVSGDGTVYDKPLAEAVKKFQQAHALKPSGLLTQATLDALDGRDDDRVADIIIANMERWRWMPHDLGQTYVIVNLPDFTLRVIDSGRLVWATKIVDGKPSTPTPIMSADMRTITINPTWNVPPSIVANEYLPLLRQDATILERMGLNVSRNPDGTIHVSQPPGPNNALGQIRFNFPNKFLVYQHDSNQKYLFANTMRAASHGCMRVEDPVKYAEVLLAIARPGEGYSAERIRRMFGVNENEIKFDNPIPVHLTYQTAFIDDLGKLQLRDDIYGRDKELLAILKGDRKNADIPIERKDNTVRRELLAMPDTAFGSGAWGRNFFARLFSPFASPFAPAAAPAPRSRAQRSRAQRSAEAHW